MTHNCVKTLTSKVDNQKKKNDIVGSYITTAMSLFSLKVSAWIRLYGIVSNAGQKLWSEVKHDANNKYTFQVNKTIPLERVFFFVIIRI